MTSDQHPEEARTERASAGPAPCRVVVCRDCCCGTAKVPGVDHARQVAHLTERVPVRVADCLDVCEHANVIVVQPSAAAQPLITGQSARVACVTTRSWGAAEVIGALRFRGVRAVPPRILPDRGGLAPWHDRPLRGRAVAGRLGVRHRAPAAGGGHRGAGSAW